MRYFLLGLLLFVTYGFSKPIMPLDEVRVGMTGTWDTVIKGDKLQTFNLKVLGISQNFVGPRKAVIICEATDPDQILMGPVAGMSGSPVYIDGKLVGAYAYGFNWPKSQTIIGVTPIESMVEIVEDFPPSPLSERYQKAFNNGTTALAERPGSGATPSSFGNKSTHDHDFSNIVDESSQRPFPIFVSGISENVLQAFGSYTEDLGVEWLRAPMAAVSNAEDWSDQQATNLEPGMPVAGVLMGGDFSFTGVGTVTWKDGERLLGFGHPFLGAGDIEIPMAYWYWFLKGNIF